MSIHNILNIGRHAIGAHRAAMELTSQNAANVATDGYSRRQGTLGGLGAGFGRSVASGVHFSDPRRVIDAMSNNNVRRAQADAGFHNTRQIALQSIEAVVAPQIGGVGESLDGFFGAFERLSSNPGGHVERVALIQDAQELTRAINLTAQGLADLQGPMVEQASDMADQISRVSARVAALNKEIPNIEAGGQEASELRDERDRLLDDLSQMVGANSVEHKDGSVTVTLGDGTALVSGQRANRLSVRVGDDGRMGLRLNQPDGSPSVSVKSVGGELHGIQTAHDTDVADAMDALDAVAFELAAAVNALHGEGFGLDGVSGRDFFAGAEQLQGAALNIGVADEVAGNPAAIATTRFDDRLPGGTDLALELADLREQGLDGLGGRSAAQAMIDMQADIGGRLDNSLDALDAAQARQGVFEGVRESTRGVSLDEELANLMTFQRGFEAATRVVQAADEMIQSVLAMI